LPRSARPARAGITKPLLVTDRGLKDMEITQRTLDLMDKAGLGRAMFAEVDPNPNEQNLGGGPQGLPRWRT
jgi:alcohol dehydrogenase class IV